MSCPADKWTVEIVQTEPPTKFLWWTSEEWLWRIFPPGVDPVEGYKKNDYHVGLAPSREDAIKDAKSVARAYETEQQRQERTREQICVDL